MSLHRFLALLSVCAFLAACGSEANPTPEPSPLPGDDDATGDDDSSSPEPGDDDTSGDDDASGDDTPLETSPTPVPLPDYEPAAPIEVLYDEVGVPHVYAATDADALYAQGYLVARDRLWQMDYNRRAGRGQLAEVLGENYFNSDVYNRALGFGPLAEQTFAKLEVEDPSIAELLTAYAAGVNAYLDAALVGQDGASLTPQVEALEYVPDYWQPTDSLVIDKLLTYNLSSTTDIDLAVGLVTSQLEPEVALDLIRPQPAEDTVIVPDFYSAPSAATRLRPPVQLDLGIPRERLGDALKAFQALKPIFAGSNSWVVSGEHTASGYPLLANDTHEGVEAPSTYHQIHLSTRAQGGTLDVIGYNFPGAPLVAFGNNQDAAWGVTTNFADVTDLFLETVIGSQVVSGGGLVELESRSETFRIREDGGSMDDFHETAVTVRTVPHHGPLLPDQALDGLPFNISVQWTGFRPVSSIRFLYDLNRATTFDAFESALTHFKVGGINFVFATTAGDIAYAARIDIPIREQVSPEYPPYSIIDGTGDYDWTDAYVPDDQIPHTHNPARGFVVTANNDPSGNVQDNNVYNDPYYLSGIYDMGSRARRITDRLEAFIEAGTPLTLELMSELQADNYSQFAARIVPYVLDAAENRPDLVTGDLLDAMALFQQWDYQTGASSGGSLLFHTWLGTLFQAIFADETFDELFADLNKDYVNMLCRPAIYFLDQTRDTIGAIEAGQAPFPSESGLNYFDNQDTEILETRDEILLSSLAEAVEVLVARHGNDLSAWTWSDAHTLTLSDRVGAALSEASSGPYPLDGGMFTVDVAEFTVTRGGAIVDVFDINNAPSQRTLYSLEPGAVTSWDALPGGQSERFDDPHFNDQLEMYLENGHRIRPYYRTDVEAAMIWRLELGPEANGLE